MEINRLIITVDGVKVDNTRFGTISINGEPVFDCNVDWLPDYFCDLTKMMQPVHAVQWYGNHGEVELVTNDPNIEMKELGVFKKSIELWEEKHQEHLKIEENLRNENLRIEEENRMIEKEHEAQIINTHNDTIYYDIEELLKEI
jgi:hypothetical protein